jgi:hypothetical protein
MFNYRTRPRLSLDPPPEMTDDIPHTPEIQAPALPAPHRQDERVPGAQRGQPLDRADRHIAEVMSGIRRRHARPPDQKEAVFADDLLRAWSRPSTTVGAACATAPSC